MPIFYGGKSRT